MIAVLLLIIYSIAHVYTNCPAHHLTGIDAANAVTMAWICSAADRRRQAYSDASYVNGYTQQGFGGSRAAGVSSQRTDAASVATLRHATKAAGAGSCAAYLLQLKTIVMQGAAKAPADRRTALFMACSEAEGKVIR